jgi:cyanate lyase
VANDAQVFFHLPSGLSFDQIAKSVGKDEVWVASGFYGQVV